MGCLDNELRTVRGFKATRKLILKGTEEKGDQDGWI